MKIVQLFISSVDEEIAIETVSGELGKTCTIEEAIENLLSFHNVTTTARDVTETI